MTFREWFNLNGTLTIALLFCAALAVFVGSFVFTKPEHLSGTVIEKIIVPSKNTYSGSRYSPVRRGAINIATAQQEQWIAVVLTDKGDTLTVHCLPDHHGAKNVGDRIHFKEYEGSLVHIQYFAHGEEEDETSESK